MIKEPTTFILGAGASCPYGFRSLFSPFHIHAQLPIIWFPYKIILSLFTVRITRVFIQYVRPFLKNLPKPEPLIKDVLSQ